MAARLDGYDWPRLLAALDGNGYVLLPALLRPAECDALAALYDHDEHFRRRVVMARHGFGRGEYQYFRYPLPDLVEDLRAAVYPHLAPLADARNAAMGIDVRHPAAHAGFMARCHRAGQRRPTPLLLRYRPGDYNRLHQDLYGEHVFPLQLAILLSEPERDFSGGEFVLTEQRPRMQSRPQVVPLRQGDAVVFAVHHRPLRSGREHPSRQSAAWREHVARRTAPYAGHHLPRCPLSRSEPSSVTWDNEAQRCLMPRSTWPSAHAAGRSLRIVESWRRPPVHASGLRWNPRTRALSGKFRRSAFAISAAALCASLSRPYQCGVTPNRPRMVSPSLDRCQRPRHWPAAFGPSVHVSTMIADMRACSLAALAAMVQRGRRHRIAVRRHTIASDRWLDEAA